jgi:hypothetical protein
MALALEFHAPGSAYPSALTSHQWRSETFDFWAFDRRVDDLATRGRPLHVLAHAREVPQLWAELAIRTQRLSGRRNACSDAPWFTRVLELHRRLHDLDKPLVRADLDHALDAWQWTLRLDGDAALKRASAMIC